VREILLHWVIHLFLNMLLISSTLAKAQFLLPIFQKLLRLPELAGIDISNSGMEDYGIELGKTTLLNGVELGLRGVKSGEHCYIVFSSRFGYGNKIVGIVPKYSPLIFEVWIKEVKKN